jgi:hypothetical protein
MRFLFFLLIFTSDFCNAQKSASIFGKWKMVAIMGDEYYHNFDKDSTVLTSRFKGMLAENKKDTAEAISLVKMAIKVFENSVYIFKSDNTYQTSIGDATFEEGKITINFEKKQIYTSAIGNNGVKQEQMYRFELGKNKLELTMASENNDVTFYLKKF